MVRYPFAIDENGTLTEVGSVKADYRHAHSYKCPYCGREMRPRLGNTRAKHFYHYDKHECNVESYVHYVGKHILYERFCSDDSFRVKFNRLVMCKLAAECGYRKWSNIQCVFYIEEIVDLKKNYDTALLEKEYRGFRPDILLVSSEKRDFQPLFLEICYKHGCSEEKRNSGYKTLEIKLSSISDLTILSTIELFVEGKDSGLEVSIFGKTEKITERELFTSSSLYKYPCTDEYRVNNSSLYCFSFYPSGKFEKKPIHSICSPHDCSTILEIVVDETRFPNWSHPLAVAARYNSRFKRCDYCHYCIKSYNKKDDVNRTCWSNSGNRTAEKHVSSIDAIVCDQFRLDSIYDSLKEGLDYYVWVNPGFHGDT